MRNNSVLLPIRKDVLCIASLIGELIVEIRPRKDILVFIGVSFKMSNNHARRFI